jgi:small-conductance mechanosensitive channel
MTGLDKRMLISAMRFFAAACLACLVFSAALAQAQTRSELAPTKVQQLVDLLEDPVVQAWLADHSRARAEASSEPLQSVSVDDYFQSRLAAVQAHILAIGRALPQLPTELQKVAGKFSAAVATWGYGRFFSAVALLIAIAVGVKWGARRLTARAIDRLQRANVASVRNRLRCVGLNFAFAIGAIVTLTFALSAAFMAIDWPESVRPVVLVYLLAFVASNGLLALFRAMLAPENAGSNAALGHLRTLPLSDRAASFWYWRLAILAGWFMFGWASANALWSLGIPIEARRIVAYVLGIGLVAIALDLTWRRSDPVQDGAAPRHTAIRSLITIAIVLVWVSWVAGAFGAFWLVLVTLVLLLALSVVRQATRHLFRPVEGQEIADVSPVVAVCCERGVRAVFIIAALTILMSKWGVDFTSVVAQETPTQRLLRGAFHALIIVLVIDLAWSVLNAMMSGALAAAKRHGPEAGESTQRSARIRTLLPILRNIVAIVLLVMGALMALAALGVEIGPLVASAGVVGVAIGFGAQTMVRDIFSGMFYMLDDAFRVGEYIQSGSYKGVVESFSLRSIKLRHHRGPLFTVPFGELGAIQNMSRDWVIDKMKISVAYGSDFTKAKKIVKQIGKELAQDPELGADILEPLKMQGVEEFGDYGITIRLKVMTKPGKQFVVRRRANAMIKKAFDENGIEFAMPVVHVAGGGAAAEAGAAAVQAKAAERAAESKAQKE